MKTVLVSAVALIDVEGRVLLAQRPAGKAMAGLWEFPGGKVESGESVEDALRRELREELGIEVIRSSALLDVHHDYGDKQVHLDVHVVWEFSGQAQGLEDQPLAWVAPQALAGHAFPAANVPIVDAVQQLLNGSAPAGS